MPGLRGGCMWCAATCSRNDVRPGVDLSVVLGSHYSGAGVCDAVC